MPWTASLHSTAHPELAVPKYPPSIPCAAASRSHHHKSESATTAILKFSESVYLSVWKLKSSGGGHSFSCGGKCGQVRQG